MIKTKTLTSVDDIDLKRYTYWIPGLRIFRRKKDLVEGLKLNMKILYKEKEQRRIEKNV